MDTLNLVYVYIIAPIITAFAGWVSAKRKYNKEVDNQEIQNMKETLEFYKALSDDNKTRLIDVLLQNKEIKELNAELIKLNTTLIDQNNKLQSQVEELTAKVEILTKCICFDPVCKRRKGNKLFIQTDIPSSPELKEE